MIFYAISHPIDTDAHPSLPAGFRWAVSSSSDTSDSSACLGAGWAPDASTAAWIADQSGAIAVTAHRLAAGTANVETLLLDYDPIPADADNLNLGV
jgi:hypothetical protein